MGSGEGLVDQNATAESNIIPSGLYLGRASFFSLYLLTIPSRLGSASDMAFELIGGFSVPRLEGATKKHQRSSGVPGDSLCLVISLITMAKQKLAHV